MRRWIVAASFVFALSATPTAAKKKPPTVDHKPCPKASQLTNIDNPQDAVPAAQAYAGATYDVNVVSSGPKGPNHDAAARACGKPVVRKSAFVSLHPQGQTCSACDLRTYVVHYSDGRYRVWYLA